MELGVLSNMPNIKQKACQKLFKQQELHRSKLLSSYKSMVAVLVHMAITCRSMRCYLKGTTGSPLVQFSSCSQNNNDTGDGWGIPVFTFWSISVYEKLAQELFQMFAWELNLKRLLVIELLSVRSEEAPRINELHWSDELYPGEFHDLSECNLNSGDPCEPILPKFEGWKSDTSNQQPHHEVLQGG
ncbi:hypothetical protein RJ639_038755 [Escallonia herrerae]|uniref:Uncharacterized protein n=1 Tax=Escallonia herrerae TaxID=1293975 RepID=A0AA89B3E8_9ASTE|nr:hypothetical protein RJ639_038755 [Escallonia herrerae]